MSDRDDLAALIHDTVFGEHGTLTTWEAIADAVIAAGWVKDTERCVHDWVPNPHPVYPWMWEVCTKCEDLRNAKHECDWQPAPSGSNEERHLVCSICGRDAYW